MKILDKNNTVVTEAKTTVLNHSTEEEIIELLNLRRALNVLVDLLDTEDTFHPNIKIGLGRIEVAIWTAQTGEFTVVVTADEAGIKKGNLELAIEKEYRQTVLDIIKKKQAKNEYINVELLPL